MSILPLLYLTTLQFVLTRSYKPEIIDLSSDQFLFEGDRMLLFCRVRADPPASARIVKVGEMEEENHVEIFPHLVSRTGARGIVRALT